MTEANDIIDAIMNLKMPRPVNIMILPSEQALVEMPTVEDSIHMVDSTGRTIYVRGTPARIAYSKSESIRMKGMVFEYDVDTRLTLDHILCSCHCTCFHFISYCLFQVVMRDVHILVIDVSVDHLLSCGLNIGVRISS